MNRKENLEARIARVEERSRHVCITADTVCGSCNARIGTKLFALYPNDMIFCYKVGSFFIFLTLSSRDLLIVVLLFMLLASELDILLCTQDF